MSIFLTVLALLVFGLLVFVATLRPVTPRYSLSELKRRAKDSSPEAIHELDRHELYGLVQTCLRVIQTILLVMLVALLLAAYGCVGLLLALVFSLCYMIIARMPILQKLGTQFYGRYENKILDFVVRFEGVVFVLRAPHTDIKEPARAVHSVEELSEIIEQSKEAIGKNERTFIATALTFQDKTVKSIMTPRATIDFIKASEFLGPLVLSELHNLGHSRLPVINEDLNHVVGILHLRDLLSLDVKRSLTAEKLMEKKVYYIHEQESLQHALAAFLKTRHHLFIVINELRETVGLLTLEDVIEALIGQRIVDEDDIHADLRAVAEREGKTNNNSLGHIDL